MSEKFLAQLVAPTSRGAQWRQKKLSRPFKAQPSSLLGWGNPGEVSTAIDLRLRQIIKREAPVSANPQKASGGINAEIEKLKTELNVLKQRVRTLEAQTTLVLGPLTTDRHLDWCNANRALLLQHPGAFVAIDIDANEICAADTDQHEFIKKLEAIPDTKSSRLYQTHTSLFE